jgi:plastocyanin
MLRFLLVQFFFSLGVLASAQARDIRVTIEGMKFNPPEVTAKRGDKIIWTNKDFFPHTVTSLDKKFDSKVIKPDKEWALSNLKPGNYNYKCRLHPVMKGSLKIE